MTTPSDVVMEPEIETVARALYDLEPFYMPAGQMVDGVELARKFSFDDAPAYRQSRAREQAQVAIAAMPRRASDPLRGGMVEALRDANGALCDANNRILELEKALQVIEAGKVRRTDPLEAYSLVVEDFARAALTKAESLNAEGTKT